MNSRHEPANGHQNGAANVTTVDLPSSKSRNLALVLATEAEKVTIWSKNGIEWRGALSEEAYLRREVYLNSQDFTKEGGITIWVLIDTTDAHRTILSSCESYRKKAIVAKNGGVKTVVTHGIGSVFCPPECRKRGYAARMMRELGKMLRTWQVPKDECAAFSILYSDIGKKFYNNHGWEPFNSSHISLPALLKQSGALVDYAHLPATRSLYTTDLPKLCTIDERLILTTFHHAPPNKTFVALIPDHATISWHHARENFVAQELHGKIPQVKGAIVGTEPGKRVWAYFTRMFYNADTSSDAGNTLHILRIVVEEIGMFAWERASVDMSAYVPAVAALFLAAQEEARQWSMAEVEVWNPTTATVAAVRMLEPEAQIVHRDEESVASLMWYGKRMTAGPVAEEVDWLCNEKYGWC